MPTPPPSIPLYAKRLGRQDYLPIWQAMRDFNEARDDNSPDQLWLLEHTPVFTQGQAGKAQHILQQSEIPIVQSDRGGQVTYHGPGQLVAYPLLDLKRRKLGVRELVTRIERSVVAFLARYGIDSAARPDAPGVYVGTKKIASLGLRVRKGRSLHGVAINIAADLRPFQLINPCGYAGLEMVNLASLTDTSIDLQTAMLDYAHCLASELESELTLVDQSLSSGARLE